MTKLHEMNNKYGSEGCQHDNHFLSYAHLNAYFLNVIKVNSYFSCRDFHVFKLGMTYQESTVLPRLPKLTVFNQSYIEWYRPMPHDLPVLTAFFSVLLVSFILMLTLIMPEIYKTWEDVFFPLLVMGFLAFFPLVWLIRYSFFTPHALPVRLNREQQKVYFYRRQVRVNPYARWPVDIIVMDWSNVRACEIRVKSSRAIIYHALHCLCINKKYSVIVDHAPLFGVKKSLGWKSSRYLESLWVGCQYYMNGNVVPGIDKSNAVGILGNIRRVKWPKESDSMSFN